MRKRSALGVELFHQLSQRLFSKCTSTGHDLERVPVLREAVEIKC